MENEVILYKKLFEQIIDEKIKEAETIKKIYESKYPLQGPFEAYYFQAVRNFFENSISHRVMNHKQDIAPKVLIKKY